MNPHDRKPLATGAAAFAALRKQQATSSSPSSPSSPSSCNAMQPGATPCNAMQPNHPGGKTNPPHDRTGSQPPKLHPITNFVLKSAALQACNAMQPHATPCNATQPNSRIEKTNPPPPISNSQHAEALTPRQLAAARLIAAGHALSDVALEMKMNRSTIWRWTRDPTFQAELRRLHEQWSAPAPATPRGPRGPDPLAEYLKSMR